MKPGPRLTHSILPTMLLFASTNARAEQPNPPCHPNPDTAADRAVVAARGDVASLPQPLKDMLVRLDDQAGTASGGLTGSVQRLFPRE
jgi:hypothetical protein